MISESESCLFLEQTAVVSQAATVGVVLSKDLDYFTRFHTVCSFITDVCFSFLMVQNNACGH